MIDQIGINLYTLQPLLKTPVEIACTLKAVREIGYPAVQVSGIGPIEPVELKKIVDDLGLVICATHTGYDDLTKNLNQIIDKHKLWNCSQIAVPSIPADLRGGAEGYIKFAEEMTEAGKKLAGVGMTLSYHNHAFEFERFNGKLGIEWIYEKSDPKYFQAEIDTYWVQYGGGDPVAWCEKMINRLPLVHLKDYGIVNNQPTYMEVGEGNLDMTAIIKICRKAKTKWYLVEQDVCPRSPLESAGISYRNLKRIMQSLA
ncbi:MAG: sugar phosphate isomerase/epimerase [Phycisphaerae bacterium]